MINVIPHFYQLVWIIFIELMLFHKNQNTNETPLSNIILILIITIFWHFASENECSRKYKKNCITLSSIMMALYEIIKLMTSKGKRTIGWRVLYHHHIPLRGEGHVANKGTCLHVVAVCNIIILRERVYTVFYFSLSSNLISVLFLFYKVLL